MNSFYTNEELKEIGFKKIGKNVSISRNTSIYGANKISVGDNVRIDDFCILSGHIIIGNQVHIAASSLLFAGKSGIVLEDFTGVSSRTAIYAESDDYSGEFLTNPTIPDKYRSIIKGKVVLKKHALVGTGCTILPGVTIGEGTSIGSMSLINKDLDEWGVFVGIPCKRIKDRSKKVLMLEEQFISDYLNINDIEDIK